MDMNLILASIGVFLVVIIALVIILLVAKAYLSPSGNVNITINGKDTLSVGQGSSLLSTLSQEGIFLPSACVVRALVDSANFRFLQAVVRF